MNGSYVLVLSAVSALAQTPLSPEPPRPVEWAQRVNVEGVPNLHRVAEGVYRSAQPWSDGFAALEKIGVKTVLSLRDDVGDESLTQHTKLKLVRVPIGFDGVDVAAFRQALGILRDPARRPVLIHCQMGADRTGLLFALYRVVEQKWTREAALKELREGGYGFGIETFAQWLAVADLKEFSK